MRRLVRETGEATSSNLTYVKVNRRGMEYARAKEHRISLKSEESYR